HVYERMEPLAPVELDGYRRGDLLSRLVADVDDLQNLHLRGVQSPLVAIAAGAVSVGVTAAFLPVAALVLGCGLLAGAVAVPLLSGLLARRTAQRQAAARGELAAELVEVLQAAPELVVYGGHGEGLERIKAADEALVRIGRRDALVAGVGDGLQLVVARAAAAGGLSTALTARSAGSLDPGPRRMLGLPAL